MQSQLVIGKQIEINLERHHKIIKLLFVVVLKQNSGNFGSVK